jgi:hypothetical protein
MNQFPCGFLKKILSLSSFKKFLNYNIPIVKINMYLECTKIPQPLFVLLMLKLKTSGFLKYFSYNNADDKLAHSENNSYIRH